MSENNSGNRIGRLDNNTLGYYRRVADTLSEGFENDEEKGIFLENVFKQLCHEALPVSQNQTASRIVESLLHEADQPQLLSLAQVFRKDWETAVTDRFASHVTQTLLLNSREQLYKNTADNDDDDDDTMVAIFAELYRYLMDNLAVHMQHTYTSHIVRVMLEILGGVQVADKIIKSKVAMHGSDSKKDVKEKTFKGGPPETYKSYLIDMVNKIVKMQKFSDHAKNHLSNPVIQTLLLVLKEVNEKEAKKACKKIMEATDMFSNENDEEVPKFLTDQIGSRLAEQVIHVSSDKLLRKIITEKLNGQFGKLAHHPIANFVLQRLIEAARDKEQYQLIFKELEGSIEDILAHNYIGIVVSLATGAQKHSANQERLIKILMKAFHCYKPEERQLKITTLLATLTTYDVFYNVKENDSDSDSEKKAPKKDSSPKKITKVNLQGSILLQKFFRFGNPRLLVTSLLDISPTELGVIACDPCGSHLLDAFASSQTVGEKNKAALFKKFKGHLFELATNKHGSRTLENFWNASNVEQRASMAEELLKYNDRLRSHAFGKFIHRNFSLFHFQQRKKEWKEIQTGNIKKRKMFQDILEKDKGSKKAKVGSGDEED